MTTNIPAGYAIIEQVSGSEPPPPGLQPTQGGEPTPAPQTQPTTNRIPQRKAKIVKWAGWIDQALVRQVLASDPLNSIHVSTTMK